MAIIILKSPCSSIAVDLGIRSVHLGVIIVANLVSAASASPSAELYSLLRETTGMKMAKLVPTVMVYVLVNIIALLIITYIPEVSMFIPNLAYK